MCVAGGGMMLLNTYNFMIILSFGYPRGSTNASGYGCVCGHNYIVWPKCVRVWYI